MQISVEAMNQIAVNNAKVVIHSNELLYTVIPPTLQFFLSLS